MENNLSQQQGLAGVGRLGSRSGLPSHYSAWIYSAVDIGIVLIIVAFGFGILAFVELGNAPFSAAVAIDTSPSALPGYALLSMIRSLLALGCSYVFAIAYGTIAARSPSMERILIPALDVLQSLPVLTFMPGLVLGLMSIFPNSRWGLEFACVLMIFTGQVWNLAFAYYESQRSMSGELRELSQVLRLSSTRRFFVLDLPNAMRSLIYNGMMSMAGGWFFLTLCESFVLAERKYKLPGLGSYLHETYLSGNMQSFVWGLLTLAGLVVGCDFLIWKPLVAWVGRYADDPSGGADHDHENTISQLWPGLRLPRGLRDVWRRTIRLWEARSEHAAANPSDGSSAAYPSQESSGQNLRGARPSESRQAATGVVPWMEQLIVTPIGQVLRTSSSIFSDEQKRPWSLSIKTWVQWIVSFAAGALVFYLLPRLPDVGAALGRIDRTDWLELTHALLMTALKVLGVLAFATAWTVPFGIWVAKRPKWSRVVQPVIQNLAAFPAPVIFPLLSFWLVGYGVHPAIVATILMTIGNQWYLLFNVLAGAGRISEELLDVAKIYHMSTWQRFRFVYLPSIFPSLVTGWLTAAGGAWNASIVAEIVYHPGGVLQADGIGAEITKATAEGNYPKLVAAIIVITIALVILNRSLWRTMHELVQRVK